MQCPYCIITSKSFTDIIIQSIYNNRAIIIYFQQTTKILSMSSVEMTC